jgi:hypothetical protein
MKAHPPRARQLEPTIEITAPPPETSAGPAPYPISDPNGCKIAASGRVNDQFFQQILSVRGWVGDEANAEPGLRPGRTGQ